MNNNVTYNELQQYLDALEHKLKVVIPDLLMPVGTVYFNAADQRNPNDIFGFGTWTATLVGRMPVGIKSTDTSFDVLGETGGSKDAVVVAHEHVVATSDNGYRIGVGGTASGGVSNAMVRNNTTDQAKATSTGVSGTNANLPPYEVLMAWKRTA